MNRKAKILKPRWRLEYALIEKPGSAQYAITHSADYSSKAKATKDYKRLLARRELDWITFHHVTQLKHWATTSARQRGFIEKIHNP